MLDELRNYRPETGTGTRSTTEAMWDTIFRKAYGLDIDGVEELWKKHF